MTCLAAVRSHLTLCRRWEFTFVTIGKNSESLYAILATLATISSRVLDSKDKIGIERRWYGKSIARAVADLPALATNLRSKT